MTTYTTESTHVVFTALSNTPNFCFSKCSSSHVFTVRITQLLPFTEGLCIFSCVHSALIPQEGPYIYIEASQKTSYHYLLLMMINTGFSLGLYFSLVYNYTPKFFFFSTINLKKLCWNQRHCCSLMFTVQMQTPKHYLFIVREYVV